MLVQFINGSEDEKAEELVNESMLSFARLDASVGTVLNGLAEKKARGGHRQLYTDMYERLLLPAMEQLTGYVHGFVEQRVAEMLVPTCNWSILNVLQNLSNAKKHIERQNNWFQELLVESRSVIKNCYVGRVKMGGDVLFLRPRSIELQSGVVEE